MSYALLSVNVPSNNLNNINNLNLSYNYQYSSISDNELITLSENETDYNVSDIEQYNQEEGIKNTPISKSYLCSKDSYGITKKEYSCLSALAYAKDLNESDDTKKYYNYLQKKSWNIKLHVKGTLHYLVGYNKKNNVKVIAFRGTYSFKDCIYDIQLFTESSVPTLAAIVPYFTKQTLSKVSYALSFVGSKLTTHELIELAENVVKEETINNSEIPIILTGHSLGGGMANILGSKMGLVSFGVSPPGTYLGRKSFEMNQKDITKYAQAIIPERDLVSSLGMSGGSQIHIPCYEHTLDCHGIDNSICVIGALCHDTELSSLCHEKWKKWNLSISS
ncbi:hypothetical protein, conserved [Entamoeba dispar SAW760]|uniref:Fungal lipase-type domain-containing protein n=1 Tax=Entamoeba dispar (strain ATCC PRA-260 / SAW760) TaxID=370354 RepID=B0E7B7_ENTDS|nr:uncharacterized protein EDI_234090 [Entamoeba dispar SAW760]EDR29580.1 hypothetical protein, conserved [Entamoeba dispar SAW760]|eukprot:EDR29580.1 hypothetical protein, conserved [Entamoeba dispar SAW760]